MSTTRDKKGRWTVRIHFRQPDGRMRRVERTSSKWTKRQAEQWERDTRRALADGTYDQQQREVPTLNEFAQEFIEVYAVNNNKPSEVTAKRCMFRVHILPLLGNRRLDSITARDVERLKANAVQVRGCSKKTADNVLAALSKMLRYAEEIELIDRVPRMRFFRAPLPDPDFLDFDEADRVLDAARKDHGGEWYALVWLAMRTGMRKGELIELRWTDVDLVAGKLRVARSYHKGHVGTPKSGKPREVPISDATVAVLKAHRHLRSKLVFCQPSGARLADSTMDDALRRICRRAGLREVGWHCMRHTFASHLAMRGVPLKTVQELLGHSTIQMTMRYAHLAPSVKRDAVQLLDGNTDIARTPGKTSCNVS